VELNGRSVLLTGATGGIGKAIARALHARGAKLLVTGRRLDVLESLKEELGDRVDVHQADLALAEGVEELAARAAVCDVLVANAALPASGRLEDFSPEQIDRALDVNLRAPMQLARAALPGMRERGEGHLVFISSMSGKVAAGGGSVYSATKFGIRGFALSLRDELLDTGVGVTTVFPGFIRDAGMWAETGLSLPRGVGTRTPEDVADAVVRGIEGNKAEIDVAPLVMRASARMSGVSPGLVAAGARRMGSSSFADALAKAQRHKR
jgi:short-subunit dehydrogenase